MAFVYIPLVKMHHQPQLCSEEEHSPERGSGDGMFRELPSSAVDSELFLNTPPSETRPLHRTSTYRNL